MTADAMAANQEDCVNSGINKYLCKLIDSDPLAPAIQAWLPPRS